ncbi:MAG: tetratricopeptide repeat protein, partial [Terriglobia bacterium]
AEYFRVKGEAQQAQDSAQEALNLFQSLDNDSGILVATLHLGNAYFIQGDFGAAQNYWEQVVTTSGRIRNNQHLASALNNLGVVYWNEGNLRKAVEHFKETLSLPALRIRERPVAMANLALIYVDYGPDPERGQQLAQEALDAFQEMGNTYWQAQSRTALGSYHSKVGQYHEALSELQQAQALFRRAGSQERMAQAIWTTARVHFSQNQYEQARQTAADALVVFQELEDSFGVTSAQIFLGWTYLRLGDTATAGPLLEEALQSAESNQYGELLPDAYNALGELARLAGDSNRARRHFQQASDLWQEPHVSQFSIEARSWLGLLEAERGNVARGLRRCQQSAARARRLKWVDSQARTGINLARVHLLRNEHGRALQVVEEIVSLDGLGLEFRALAYHIRGQALEALGRREPAQAAYQEAQRAVRELQQTLPPEHRESFARRPDLRPLWP